MYKRIFSIVVKPFRFYAYFILFMFALMLVARASDILDDLDKYEEEMKIALEGLTCESKGIYRAVIRGEMDYTCAPNPFFQGFGGVFEALSIIDAQRGVMALNMSNKLIPHNCDLENRADITNRTLSFGLCNNIKLAIKRASLIERIPVIITSSLISNSDPIEEIRKEMGALDYYDIYRNVAIGSEGMFPPLGATIGLRWKVMEHLDQVCLYVKTFQSWSSIGCKYVKEPFPKSKYISFMDVPDARRNNGYNGHEIDDKSDKIFLSNTCSAFGSCYEEAKRNSRTLISISAPIVLCIKQAVARTIQSPTICKYDPVTNGVMQTDSSIYKLQSYIMLLTQVVLVAYVMLFGIRMLFGMIRFDQGELITSFITFMVVVYFSLGFNNTTETDISNGVISVLFPVIMTGISGIAEWVVSATNNGLCVFDSAMFNKLLPGEVHYESVNLAIWDALDCRVVHYLGLDAIADYVRAARNEGSIVISASIPPYLWLLVPAIMSGNINFVFLVLSIPILIVVVAAYVVNSFAVSFIMLGMLGIIAPFMFLTLLFTKRIFVPYAQLLISFVLKPAISLIFLALMFNVLDQGFYDGCKYKAIGVSNGSNSKKIAFAIDRDKARYDESEWMRCTHSLGYLLSPNTSFDLVDKYAGSSILNARDDQITARIVQEQTKAYSLLMPNISAFDNFAKADLSSVKKVVGLFFDFTLIDFNTIKNILIAAIKALFIMYLCYNMSGQIESFVVDLIGGINTGNATLNPKDAFDFIQIAVGSSAIRDSDEISKGGGKSPDQSVSDSHKAKRSSISESIGGYENPSDDDGSSEDSGSSDDSGSAQGAIIDGGNHTVPSHVDDISPEDVIISRDAVHDSDTAVEGHIDDVSTRGRSDDEKISKDSEGRSTLSSVQTNENKMDNGNAGEFISKVAVQTSQEDVSNQNIEDTTKVDNKNRDASIADIKNQENQENIEVMESNSSKDVSAGSSDDIQDDAKRSVDSVNHSNSDMDTSNVTDSSNLGSKKESSGGYSGGKEMKKTMMRQNARNIDPSIIENLESNDQKNHDLEDSNAKSNTALDQSKTTENEK